MLQQRDNVEMHFGPSKPPLSFWGTAVPLAPLD